MRNLVILLITLALFGCGTEPSDGDPLPPTAVPLVPDPVYRGYWAQMEACSGLTADFEKVTWYLVPGFDPFKAPGVDELVLGFWYAPRNWIVLLQFVPNPPAIIRHEMLHAILKRTDHPFYYFETRCGATIAGPPLPA